MVNAVYSSCGASGYAELNEFAEQLQRASVRAMYPEASEREVFLRVAASTAKP